MTISDVFKYVFSLSEKELISILFSLELFIGAISTLTIFPLIFNLIIIPKIEKKIGEKLEYRNIVYNMQPLVLGKYYEIMFYIVVKHMAFKLGFNSNKIKLGPRFALQLVNYDVQKASLFELFMCYLAFANIMQLIGFGAYLSLMHH